MKTDQGENEDNLHFLQRIDAYQRKRGIRRREACEEIRISEGQLSKIRNFQTGVNLKFWQRLEAAERAAGIAPEPEDPGGPRLNQSQSSPPEEDRLKRLEEEMKGLHSKMDQILECLEKHKKI